MWRNLISILIDLNAIRVNVQCSIDLIAIVERLFVEFVVRKFHPLTDPTRIESVRKGNDKFSIKHTPNNANLINISLRNIHAFIVTS